MYGDMEDIRDRIWCITAYGSVGASARKYNRVFNIIAETAEEAIAVVQDDTNNYLVIVSVNCKGPVGLKY